MRKESSILSGHVLLLKIVPKIHFTTAVPGACYGNSVYLNHGIMGNTNCPKLSFLTACLHLPDWTKFPKALFSDILAKIRNQKRKG